MSTWIQATKRLTQIEAILKMQLSDTILSGCTTRQLAVLRELYYADYRHASDLARAIGSEPTSFTPILDALDDMGLVNRQADPRDRRANFIILTERGQQVRTLVLDAWYKAETE